MPNPGPAVSCAGLAQSMSVQPNCPDGLVHGLPEKVLEWRVTFWPNVRPLKAHVAIVIGNTPLATVSAFHFAVADRVTSQGPPPRGSIDVIARLIQTVVVPDPHVGA